jgi:hypothetical protein
MGDPLSPGGDLLCPSCAAVDIKALGTEGFAGRKLAAVLLGFLADIAFAKAEQKNTKDRAIIYECSLCGKRWKAFPAQAAESGCRETSREIHVTRTGGIAGGAIARFVYLNGKKIGPVKNGGRITFTTERKHNLVFVTDHLGHAFDTRHFDVPAGKQIELRFKRKFV